MGCGSRGLWVEGLWVEVQRSRVVDRGGYEGNLIFVLHGGHTRLIDSQANVKYRPTLKTILDSYLGPNCYPIAIKRIIIAPA